MPIQFVNNLGIGCPAAGVAGDEKGPMETACAEGCVQGL